MKIPMSPPKLTEIMLKFKPSGLLRIMDIVSSSLVNDRYLHWDQLRYREPPEGCTLEEWWVGLKLRRLAMVKSIPLCDKHGDNFLFTQPDPVLEALYNIALGAGGSIGIPTEITEQEKDRYYFTSLIEEAITSSQLEGASTTRDAAKEMLRTNRPPRDHSEQMILNNFQTMKRIGELRYEDLDTALVFEIHRIITEGTLGDSKASGRFRTQNEDIKVWTEKGLLLHSPPPASELPDRMKIMCDFANGKTPNTFVHPALRAIILHFWLAYDHPFADGNGRTARALFYWSMLRSDFWLFEFISISSIIRKAPAQYARSFLYTESDDNDLTYFVSGQIKVIMKALEELVQYVKRKTKQVRAMEAELRGVEVLNHRQKALISHALRHPQHRYSIESHKRSHNVVYQTARSDLLNMVERGLLIKNKIGRRLYFSPVPDLNKSLVIPG